MNDKWMTDLRTKVGGYERKAPDGLLDDIKQEMARRGLTPMPPVEKPRRPWGVVGRWAVAATVAALVGVATWKFMQPSPTDGRQPVVATRQGNVSHPTGKPSPSNLDATMAMTNNSRQDGTGARQATPIIYIASVQPSSSATTPAADLSGESKGEAEAPSNMPPVTATPPTTSKSTPPTRDNADNRSQAVPHSNTPHHQPTTTWPSTDDEPLLAMATPRHHDKASLGAFFGGAGNFSDTGAEQGDDAMVASDMLMNDLASVLSLSPREQANKLVDSQEKHHQPIRVGLSLSIPLQRRWSLHTGLTYSTMRSTFTNTYVSYETTTTQRLHYVGLPLAASYSVWQNRHANVYFNMGGEVQKLVGSATKTTTHHFSGQEERESGHIGEHRPVFSASASAGVSYSLWPGVSIYVEPGVAYHFKNGSGVKSVYTDQPLMLNVNMGIRVGEKVKR